MINYNRLSFHFSSRQVKLYIFSRCVCVPIPLLSLSLVPNLSLLHTYIERYTLINTASSQMYNDY